MTDAAIDGALDGAPFGAAVVVAHRDEPLTSSTRAVARSTGTHPGDWGRAVALALDHLAVQVAFRDDVPEAHVLEGRDVLLHALPGVHGVEIVVELAADRVGRLDDPRRDETTAGAEATAAAAATAAAERRLRDSVGYAPGTTPRSRGQRA